MKNLKANLAGITLIAIGIILGLNSLEITNINIFFKGWWTLFIFVPCLFDFIEGDNRVVSLGGMLIAVVLLLGARGIVDYNIIGKLIFPFILVICGLSIIVKDGLNTKFNKKVKEIKENNTGKTNNCITIFGGDEIDLSKKEFKGGNLVSVFGGIDYDLSKAIIKEDSLINCTAIFGGIDLIVPEGVNIEVKSTSIFGGVENKKRVNNDKNKTIYINSICIFGGVDIK